MIAINTAFFFISSLIAYTFHVKGLSRVMVAFNAIAAVVNLYAVIIAIVNAAA